MNTGGFASNMELLDWMAGQETIGDEELSAGICEHFAGPRPTGDWKTNPAGWYEWEARWRAGVKYMRASAMLAEKARREADHSPDAGKMVELQAANRELVEALSTMEMWVPTYCENPVVAEARAILSKHKATK